MWYTALTSDVCGGESKCEEQDKQRVRGEHVGSESVHVECEDCVAFLNRITTTQLRFQPPQRYQQHDAGALHALRLQIRNKQKTLRGWILFSTRRISHFEVGIWLLCLSVSQNKTAETLTQE